ncbi:TetR/AcrR family transcriptional regulator [Promicromonospora kroppenstedtii]|uniref:TetR/AcrR family transcriptional regulator n=1 Tax=Promicromonospora kroppenstedtii TaxID=440482 RepID=UPI001B7F9271|nr:TetR/AcrR family transcriptional regulator [Promicromonospora kroppenstedtii]
MSSGMGLRELKAHRTRAAILSVALELFERQGYDATTMEQIAEAAEVAPTTLYRYYPTKDSTLVSQLIPEYGRLADDLRERPAPESLAVALGQALHARLQKADDDALHISRVRRMIDSVPAARARVWDSWYQETALLEQAIADRTGADTGELWVQITARTCMTVLQMALDMLRAPDPRPAAQYADEIIRELSRSSVVLPTLPD